MPLASWRAEDPSQCGWYQYVPARQDSAGTATRGSHATRGTARVRQRDLVLVQRGLARADPAHAGRYSTASTMAAALTPQACQACAGQARQYSCSTPCSGLRRAGQAPHFALDHHVVRRAARVDVHAVQVQVCHLRGAVQYPRRTTYPSNWGGGSQSTQEPSTGWACWQRAYIGCGIHVPICMSTAALGARGRQDDRRSRNARLPPPAGPDRASFTWTGGKGRGKGRAQGMGDGHSGQGGLAGR
jgi:hypothetical protein